MYVLVLKVCFAAEAASRDRGHYRRVCLKIRSKYPGVCAQIYPHDDFVILVACAMSFKPQELQNIYEHVIALCEREGLGRAVDEGEVVIEHIDSFF